MEIYILDNKLRYSQIIDKFESLIWTERWHEYGDFELILKSNLQNRGRFMIGTRLMIDHKTSIRYRRIMTVETVEDKVDDEGKELLVVKGRSLEAILEDRVAKKTMANLSDEPVWIIKANPRAVAELMFSSICKAPSTSDPNDVIPFLGILITIPEIPAYPNQITWEQKPDTLYNAIRSICSIYDLGFRLYHRHFEDPELYFDVYTGRDRTTLQDDYDPVIFSTGQDNIQSMTEFSTVQNSKNVAYVFSENLVEVVYADGVDPDVSGFERRVIFVSVDVPAEETDPSALLIQRGKEALFNHRALSIFDGEINQHKQYKYGVDYDLGDRVEMRNKDGIISYKRVTEQIFVDDAEGERSYPTLSIGEFVSVETWLAYSNKDTAWEDFTDEVWADM